MTTDVAASLDHLRLLGALQDDFLTTMPEEIGVRTEIRADCKMWLGATSLEARRRALRK